MSCASRTPREDKTPESNKSVTFLGASGPEVSQAEPRRSKEDWKRNKKGAVHPCHVLTRFFALFHEVRLMRKPHSPCHVKRHSWEYMEP